jgi:predicted hotdog family 3-hydroxylacyl-ACP dehydratase
MGMSHALMNYTLEQLLPHRAPMVLLDTVLDTGAEHAAGRLAIRADSPFFDAEQGGVPAWVGIEYMAQTIAIWLGSQQLSRGLPVKIGFLLGTRAYDTNVPLFPLGSVLTVHIEALYSEENALGAFACRIEGDAPAGEGIEVTARINAFRPENPHAFVKSAAEFAPSPPAPLP